MSLICKDRHVLGWVLNGCQGCGKTGNKNGYGWDEGIWHWYSES